MNDFNALLGMAESGGDYGIVNSLGYAGKYQFGDARLEDYKRATGEKFTKQQFLSDPALQERVQKWHVADIDRNIDRFGLDRYFGQKVGGTVIDRNALRAVAHLGGIGGMRKFVESGGEYNPADAYGTSLSDYAAKFGGKPDDARRSVAPRIPINMLLQALPRSRRIEPIMLGYT